MCILSRRGSRCRRAVSASQGFRPSRRRCATPFLPLPASGSGNCRSATNWPVEGRASGAGHARGLLTYPTSSTRELDLFSADTILIAHSTDFPVLEVDLDHVLRRADRPDGGVTAD